MRTLSRYLGGSLIGAILSCSAQAAPFAYIANAGAGHFGEPGVVSVVDTASYTVVATVEVGLGPFGVCVNATGERVYVSNSLSDSISIIDTATNAVVRTISVGANPTGVAATAAGERVFVSNSGSGNVSVIDTMTGETVTKVTVGRTPGGIAMSPTGERAYVANYDSNTISVIDTATYAVVATIGVARFPFGIAVKPDGTRLYVTNGGSNSIGVIDAGTYAVIGTVAVGSSPTGVAANPAGTRIYVANMDSDSVSVIDTATNRVVTTVGVGAMPTGIAVTPSGTRVYVANNDSSDVSVIDTTSNQVIATVTVGELPIALGLFIGPDVTLVKPPNYQGLWWKSPAGSESGWGINFAHQGDVIFATWFTYGSDNQPQWFTIRAEQSGTNVYSGPVSGFTGPPFNSVPFPANANVKTSVGTAAITFAADGRSATFNYTVNGITQTKQIVPQQFTPGVPLPTCVWGAQPDLTLATNYQDLWWVTNGDESGWGINFTHQGSIIFATWFTYDVNGKAWWLFSVARETAVPKVYAGEVKTATGPPFNADPFDPNAVVRNTVGNATITVIDGNHATFDYAVNGVTQTKHLTRQVFAPPGTVCQ